MFPGTVIAAAISYLVMLAAYFQPHRRYFHIPVMISVIVFDVGMPFYLYTHRNWWKRLIDQHEILSILVWFHFFLLIAMYALEVVQILTARRMLKGDAGARADHRGQGKAMLLVRGLVILSGATLVESE
jgi:hypothetical protein